MSLDILGGPEALLTARKVGAALFVATEGWSFGIAVYFCVFTLTFLTKSSC